MDQRQLCRRPRFYLHLQRGQAVFVRIVCALVEQRAWAIGYGSSCADLGLRPMKPQARAALKATGRPCSEAVDGDAGDLADIRPEPVSRTAKETNRAINLVDAGRF